MKHRKQYHTGGNKKRFQKKENDKPQVSGRSIEVRNGNVNFAIRKLKKVLERMDFQKEVAKREYFEKPSATTKLFNALAPILLSYASIATVFK